MTAAMTTTPNAAAPIGYRRKIAGDAAQGAEKHAAGVVHVSPDGDILLLRRAKAEPNFGGHWALPGGGVEAGESPAAGAARENREEIGIEIDPDVLRPLHRSQTPTGIAFHTFARAAGEKFAPRLNDEHDGYVWAGLDNLPSPMHPAVADMLREQVVGDAEDMSPEDWQGLRQGFLKWLAEEEQEPEHAQDAALALDRDSVRSFDPDGRMHVAKTNISKANICPYRGAEIPGWQELGLEKDRVYQLLRDPSELKKAAPTSNGLQLLRRHIPVNVDDHKPHDVVGCFGTDADFDGEYLTNSITVWSKDAIEGIESDDKREISMGYHYRPDMTPGNFGGKHYDGIMRDIVFNHGTLVEDGRAGPDVLVGDSMENLKMSKPTRLAALTIGMTSAAVAPLLALDAKLELPRNLFDKLTSKNFKSSRSALESGIRLALDGKLRKGIALDATAAHVKTVLDALESVAEGADESVSEEQHKAMEAAAHGESKLGIPKDVGEEYAEADKGKTFDAEPVMSFLKEKGLSEDDLSAVADMLPKPALDSEEEEAEEDNDGKKVPPPVVKDKKGAKDNDMPITKHAMDAAIQAAQEATAKRVREAERGVRVALADVRPWVGELPPALAFDSAEGVYRHALGMLDVDGAKTLHADALKPILHAQPKPGARRDNLEVQDLALDEATIDEATKLAPGLSRIRYV